MNFKVNVKRTFSFLVFVALMSLPAALFGQRENPLPGLTLRQQVDTEILNLLRNIEKTPDTRDQLRALSKSLASVQDLRFQSPGQLTGDEAYLESLATALAQIPGEATFEYDQCTAYVKNLAVSHHRKPASLDKDLAREKALLVLDAVCDEIN